MSYLPSQSGGAPQITSWTYAAGDGIPPTSHATSNNDSDPSAVTSFIFDGLVLSFLPVGSILNLAVGDNVYSYNVGTVTVSGSWVAVAVTFFKYLGSIVEFSGTVYVSISPFQLPSANLAGDLPAIGGSALTGITPAQVGAATAAQGTAADSSIQPAEFHLATLLTTDNINPIPDGDYAISSTLGGTVSIKTGIITAWTPAG